MKRRVWYVVAAVLISGCTSKPYTGERFTTTKDPSGLTVTKSETRSMLPGKVLAGSESELRQITAEVLATDPVSRQITLRTADNKTQTVVAGTEVRNFPQIRVGDQVSVDYFASVKFEVRPPSPDELARAQSPTAVFGRAPKGTKPGGVIGIGDVAILVIDAIDKPSQTVTLSGPGGKFRFKSNHPENFDFIQRGDNVVVEVAELLAAKVSPRPS